MKTWIDVLYFEYFIAMNLRYNLLEYALMLAWLQLY